MVTSTMGVPNQRAASSHPEPRSQNEEEMLGLTHLIFLLLGSFVH